MLKLRLVVDSMCEHIFDYSMDDAKSIVAQAHELQLLVGEIAHLGCVLPLKFVAASIVAKLPTSWRDFATSLKHKREEISVDDLIAALDVEEKARAKDAPSTTSQNNQINANVIEKRYGMKNKGFKPNKTTSFKKKTDKKDMRNITCFMCGENGHMAKDCHFRKSKDVVQPKKKVVNVIIGEVSTGGYGNPPIVFSAYQSTNWWVDTRTNVHVCSDIFLFSSYQVAGASSVLMGNGLHASVLGVGTVDLRLTLGKITHLKNVQHAPTINKNLVSDSLLCRHGYKLVFESNKIVMSKFGNIVGKGYESGGLFRISTLEYYYNLNAATGLNKCEVNIWHSRFFSYWF